MKAKLKRESRMLRRIALIFLTSLIFWAPGYGQEQKAASQTYVLKAARMFDGKSNGLVTPGLVVVSGGKIAGVGTGAAIPAGAETIDLGDATLLPGFIDAHTHLTDPYQRDYRQGEMDLL